MLTIVLTGMVKVHSQKAEIEQLRKTLADYKADNSNYEYQPDKTHENEGVVSNINDSNTASNLQWSGASISGFTTSLPCTNEDHHRVNKSGSHNAVKYTVDESYFETTEGEFNKTLERLSYKGELTTSELKHGLDHDYFIAEYDHEKAEENHTSLNNLLDSHPDFSQFAILESECKSFQCRLSIAISDRESTVQLMTTLPSALQRADARFNQVGLINSFDENNGELTLYVMGIDSRNSQQPISLQSN